MFEQFVKMPHVVQRLQRSKFKNVLDRYASYLISRRYSNDSIRRYRNSAEHFFQWAEFNCFKLPLQLDKTIVDTFLHQHLPICQCPLPAPRCQQDVRASLHLLLHMQQNASGQISCSKPTSESDIIISEFDDYLRHICGLAKSTRSYHRRHVNLFLKKFFNQSTLLLDRLTPSNVLHFLYEHIPHYKRRTFGLFVYSLRSFFKFLQSIKPLL